MAKSRFYLILLFTLLITGLNAQKAFTSSGSFYGKIKGNKFFNSNGRFIGTIRNNTCYAYSKNNSNLIVWIRRENRLYNKHFHYIGKVVEQCCKANTDFPEDSLESKDTLIYANLDPVEAIEQRSDTLSIDQDDDFFSNDGLILAGESTILGAESAVEDQNTIQSTLIEEKSTESEEISKGKTNNSEEELETSDTPLIENVSLDFKEEDYDTNAIELQEIPKEELAKREIKKENSEIHTSRNHYNSSPKNTIKYYKLTKDGTPPSSAVMISDELNALNNSNKANVNAHNSNNPKNTFRNTEENDSREYSTEKSTQKAQKLKTGHFARINEINYKLDVQKGLIFFYSKRFSTLSEAKSFKSKFIEMGYNDCFISKVGAQYKIQLGAFRMLKD